MSYSSRKRSSRACQSASPVIGAPIIRGYNPARAVACQSQKIAYGAVQVDGIHETVRSYESGDSAAHRYDGTRRQDSFIDGNVLFAERQAQRHTRNRAEAEGSEAVTRALDLLDSVARE